MKQQCTSSILRLSALVFVLSLAGLWHLQGQTLTATKTVYDACPGEKVVITIVAGGEFSSYRWQYSPNRQSANFVDIPKPGDEIGGEETTMLTLDPIPDSFEKPFFRLCGQPSQQGASKVYSPIITVNVGFNPSSFTPSINASVQNICSGQEVTLTAQIDAGVSDPSAVFEWFKFPPMNSDTQPYKKGGSITESPESVTSYYVRLRTDCGLSKLSAAKTISIKAPGQPVENITFSTETPCEGQMVKLSASGGDGGTGSVIHWYTGPNGGGVDLGTNNPLDITATATTTYYVRREVVCANEVVASADYSEKLTVTPGPTAEFDQFPDLLCEQVAGTFSAKDAGNGATYTWDFAGGTATTTNGKGPITVSYTNNGTKKIKLTITKGNCIVPVFRDLMVIDQPSILVNGKSPNSIFSTPDDFVFQTDFSSNVEVQNFEWTCELRSGQLDGLPFSGSGTGFSQKWTLPDGEEQAVIDCAVTANAEECSGTDDFSITVRKLLFVPNILSPNGDAFNETWAIKLLITNDFSASDFEIELYDRNGRCYKGCKGEKFTIGQASDWDGRECPPGVSMYRILGPDGFQKTGALTIVKN